jgi:hypothetical protein
VTQSGVLPAILARLITSLSPRTAWSLYPELAIITAFDKFQQIAGWSPKPAELNFFS